MALTKKDQQHLEASLSENAVKEHVLDELQAMRDAFNALLAKLDTDFTAQNAVVTSSQLDTDYDSTLSIEDIREGGKATRL